MSDNETLFTAAGIEVDGVAEMHRRSWFTRSHSSGKHRAQDYIARLERDLAASRALNETLSANLSAQIEENVTINARFDKLVELVEDLDRRLKVAEEANVANANVTTFNFQERLIEGHEDMATMPVPQVELMMDEPSLIAVASNAAVAMLDRVVPKTTSLPALVPAYVHSATETTPLVPVSAEELEQMDDEMELYNATEGGWVARQHQSLPPVTWGSVKSQPRTLHTNMSTTGTFRVVPLHQRGTGPTAFPSSTV